MWGVKEKDMDGRRGTAAYENGQAAGVGPSPAFSGIGVRDLPWGVAFAGFSEAVGRDVGRASAVSRELRDWGVRFAGRARRFAGVGVSASPLLSPPTGGSCVCRKRRTSRLSCPGLAGLHRRCLVCASDAGACFERHRGCAGWADAAGACLCCKHTIRFT